MTIRLSLILTLTLCAGAGAADPVARVREAAKASFFRMPDVEIVSAISGHCGADGRVNARAAYCTSQNVILLAQDQAGHPRAAYLVAHLYGHAAQVQHGVADVALRTISARRDEEPALRAMVEGQVDCVAGVLMRRAGLPAPDLSAWFSSDPFPDPHWGRNPLKSGPLMGISIPERNQMIIRGYSSGLSACQSGEFGPDLLVTADRM